MSVARSLGLTCLLILPVAACARSSTPLQAHSAPAPSDDVREDGAFSAPPKEAAGLPSPVSDREKSSGASADTSSETSSETNLDGRTASRPEGNADRRAQRNAETSTAAPSAAPAPHATSSDGAYRAEVEKKVNDRPGLGTEWGETRTSYVSNRAFERADFSRPFAMVSLNYNDEAGIQAMARRTGNSYASFDGSGVLAAEGTLSVRLLDEAGTPLPSANFGGRDYVAGSDGQRYVIQIENHSEHRFEAVATVDGLDVVDGKEGTLTKRGYLIEPWATLQIDGFRRSQSTVAAFRFGAVKDSYAARKGNDRNVGVIGVAFFQERGAARPWTERELDRRDSANPFPGRFASPPPAPLAR